MSVSRYKASRTAKDGVNLAYGAKKASTAITENTFLAEDSNGQLLPATATGGFIVGVSVERVTSADDNYATTDNLAYDQALEGEEFLVDVDDTDTSGFVVGAERTLNDAGEVKAAAVNTGGGEVALVVVRKIISDTKAVVTLKTVTNNS